MLRVFPLRSRTKQEYLLSPLLFNIVLEDLAEHLGKGKKRIQIGKEEVKLPPFTDDIIIHVENPKDFTKKQN